jgi:hypothetical protein
MKKVVHLFASQRVNRKARTDNEEVFKEKVTLITNKQMSIGQLADFARLVKDMGICGIVIGDGKVVLKGDKIEVLNGNTSAAMFEGGKLNANLIDAQTIVVNGLQANGIQGNTIDAKNATISNLNVNNVLLSGSLRSPFTLVGDSFTTDYSDNAVMQVDNDGYSWVYSIPWNVEQAGRRICILSNLWGGKQITSSSASISVPDDAQKAGCRFFENGIAKTKLDFSTEVLELMAYGDISARTENDTKSHYLYGWIVLNRIDLMTNRSFGRNKKLLAYGKVTGTSSGASIKYRTFDGSELSVNRLSTGHYEIIAPRKWFLNEGTGYFDLEAVFVNLTGIGYSYDDKNKASPIKATFWGATKRNIWGYDDETSICIEVHTSDDDTVNDGSFNFEISNFDDFNT